MAHVGDEVSSHALESADCRYISEHCDLPTIFLLGDASADVTSVRPPHEIELERGVFYFVLLCEELHEEWDLRNALDGLPNVVTACFEEFRGRAVHQ